MTFAEYFAEEWQRTLEAVQVPGMPDASWDRKAAWLVWQSRPTAQQVADSLRLLLPIPRQSNGQG